MKLYEKEIIITKTPKYEDTLNYISWAVDQHLSKNEIPIRFVVTKTDDKNYHCELGILFDAGQNFTFDSIFSFYKRSFVNHNTFNTVLIIPTGIGCEIGGHAGDAGPVARLMGTTCDNLILHPNVVNASDINEMPENALYVEGSIISRLLMGTVGLYKVRMNRILPVIGQHDDSGFSNAAINMVSGARASFGIDCDKIVTIPKEMSMDVGFSESGCAVGKIRNIDKLYNRLKNTKDYDAIAISSVINTTEEIRNSYFDDKTLVNPWGGIEAMLTHFTSLVFDVPSAHAPMDEDLETSNSFLERGIVDPRKASEVVSVTFLFSVLKGLHKSPRIINRPSRDMEISSNVITAADVNCIVIPDGCVGLPTLAAIKQNIPIIAVKGNKNIMKNDLSRYSSNVIYVENYFEAVGVIGALREGIALESLVRPLNYTKEL